MPANHHIGGALDAVGQRFAAAVQVVELRLRHGIVDVDGGNQQFALLLHLVEPVNAGGGLFGNAAPFLSHLVPVLRIFGVYPLEEVLDDLFFVAAGRRVHPIAALFQFVALMDQQRDVAAIVHHQLRTLPSG